MDAIDAEFIAVTPQVADTTAHNVDRELVEPENEPDEADWYDVDPEDWEPEPDEDQSADISAELEALRRRVEWMEGIFADDNHTAAAIREIEKLKAVNDGLQTRLDAVIAENAQLQGRLNYWEAKAKKLEKSNAK